MADLLVIVPTRGRPDNARRVLEAWDATRAWDDGAALSLEVDADDPALDRYLALADARVRVGVSTCWRPMVHKLNMVATNPLSLDCFALGFAGDDHLPRTVGWARAYLDALREMRTGIVFGDDLLQGERLPTQWTMTSDIVRALGRMVPAPVQHLYCDNAILELGRAAGCIRFLPDVVIEHMHPVARKSNMDEGYRRVNSPQQYRHDLAAFRLWRDGRLSQDAATVRALREVVTDGVGA